MKSLKINYLAVIVAAIVTFALGAMWYIVFSDTWMSLAGLTEEKIQSSGAGAAPYIISFATYLAAAYAMALLFKSMNIQTLQTGAMTGALIGAILIGGNIITNNTYEMKPLALSVLNGGFSAVSCTAMGAILGAWRKYN
jgi:Protein of unknown function (DUF1761)